MKINSMCCFGGQSLAEDLYRLRKGVHVMVGTAARILDLTRRGHCDLSKCRYFVLDEADKMLSDNFLPVVEDLLEDMDNIMAQSKPYTLEEWKRRPWLRRMSASILRLGAIWL